MKISEEEGDHPQGTCPAGSALAGADVSCRERDSLRPFIYCIYSKTTPTWDTTRLHRGPACAYDEVCDLVVHLGARTSRVPAQET